MKTMCREALPSMKRWNWPTGTPSPPVAGLSTACWVQSCGIKRRQNEREAVVLGFDTSCYTTSVAAVDLAGRPVASCRRLLPVPSGERRLRRARPCLSRCVSYRCLWRNWAQRIRGCTIAAVCASIQPRDEQGSYMPVFQAGDAQARGVAARWVSCFASNHQRGHLEAALVDSGA